LLLISSFLKCVVTNVLLIQTVK